MAAPYLLGSLAIVFLFVGSAGWARDGHLGPAARTSLTVGLIFAAVSAWTFMSGVH